MKKILQGFIAIGLLTFVGCEKDDENNNNESNSENSTETKTSGEICDGSVFSWKDVTNPVTGKTWMDRNLGASQVATSSTDSLAYGDLYQWGRGSDGHQCRNSDTTSSLSNGDDPGHGDFITKSSSPYDWRETRNNSLWQGVDGVNNPCPTGYRLPTKTEWEEEVESWTSEGHNGAYGSVLKLPMAGHRHLSNSSLSGVGTIGYYWSSAFSVTAASGLYFMNGSAGMGTYFRAYGHSVRCIKD